MGRETTVAVGVSSEQRTGVGGARVGRGVRTTVRDVRGEEKKGNSRKRYRGTNAVEGRIVLIQEGDLHRKGT